MTAATLPSAEDIARAAADDEVFHELWTTLKTEGTRTWFRREVEAAYNASHAPRPLSDTEKAVLAFARRHFTAAGAREQAIRDEFGYSATRYYQALNALIDNPAALKFDPVTVGRLRRQREVRQARRAARPDTTRSAA